MVIAINLLIVGLAVYGFVQRYPELWACCLIVLILNLMDYLGFTVI